MIQWINVNKTNHAIRWLVIYPVDSVIQLLNNPGQDIEAIYRLSIKACAAPMGRVSAVLVINSVSILAILVTKALHH